MIKLSNVTNELAKQAGMKALARMLKRKPIKTIGRVVKGVAKDMKEARTKPEPWKWAEGAKENFVRALDPKKRKYVGHFKNPRQAQAAFRRMSKTANILNKISELNKKPFV